jgi:hypothetical protein
MYAIVEQGSKQYKVAVGDKLEIELTDVAPDATTIELDKVLFIGGDGASKIGQPTSRAPRSSLRSSPTRPKRWSRDPSCSSRRSAVARTARSESATGRSTCR